MDLKEVHLDEIDTSQEDQRFADLVGLINMDNVQQDSKYVEIARFPNGNTYIRALVTHSLSRQESEAYFVGRTDWTTGKRNGSPVRNDEFLQFVKECQPKKPDVSIESTTTEKVQYMKEFNDGLVHIVAFGDPHTNKEDSTWAIYGHIVER